MSAQPARSGVAHASRGLQIAPSLLEVPLIKVSVLLTEPMFLQRVLVLNGKNGPP